MTADIWQQFWSQFSGWEGAAVTLTVAYLLLAMRENILCWYAAFAGAAIYVVVFWDVSLLMDSSLNVYYLAMAVFGWRQWKKRGRRHSGVKIHRWNLKQHVLAIGAITVTSLGSGYLLSNHSSAAWPYLDSFTTWGAVLTTWMVARKVLENWLYWFVIDGVSIFLYIERGLYPTALLFSFYTVAVCFGFVIWRRHCLAQTHEIATSPGKLA